MHTQDEHHKKEEQSLKSKTNLEEVLEILDQLVLVSEDIEDTDQPSQLE